MSVYSKILSDYNDKKLAFAVLVDPDKTSLKNLKELLYLLNQHPVDYIFVGGSLISSLIDEYIAIIKKESSIPVILFPGSVLQISKGADAMLFLSLISGRNPEFLIGNHVVAAPVIRNLKIETIPTGYILIENGSVTSVEYMSNTKPIPREKPDIIVATAMAGEMLGQKLIYLECGSGAQLPVPLEVIKQVRNSVNLPIIVGGGIKTEEEIINVKKAGADIIVIGSILENNPSILPDLLKAIRS